MSYDSICCFRNSNQEGYRILWEITNRCNQKCAFCHAKGTKDVGLDDVKRIYENLSDLTIRDIIITGGEPLLNDQVFEILDYLKKQNVDVDMCSNGTRIDSNVASKLKKYLSEISISFDTDDFSLYKELRGVDLLSNVYNGIQNLLYEGISVHLTCVINKKNIKKLESIIKTATELGVDSISFLRVIPEIASDSQRAKGLSIDDAETSYALDIINSCRKKYDITINTKRLISNCHEVCGAGKNILGITTDGYLLNCIMNRNSNCLDILNNHITDSTIKDNFLFQDDCIV